MIKGDLSYFFYVSLLHVVNSRIISYCILYIVSYCVHLPLPCPTALYITEMHEQAYNEVSIRYLSLATYYQIIINHVLSITLEVP